MNVLEDVWKVGDKINQILKPVNRTSIWPRRDKSMAFWLMLNVTDLSRDLSPPVHKTYVTAIHRDDVTNVAAANVDRRFYAIFSQYGSRDDYERYRTRLVANLGTPMSYSMQASPDESGNSSTLFINAHGSSNTIQITRDPVRISFVDIPNLAVCMEQLPGELCPCAKEHPIIKQFYVQETKDIPQECAPVRLLPHCTRFKKEQIQLFAPYLEMMNQEDYYEHTHRTQCYKSIQKLDWAAHPKLRSDV